METMTWTWPNASLEPGNCFVEFKLDTPYFGGLSIERFQLRQEVCDEIQASGKIQWNGNTYRICQDRTADLRKLAAPNSLPIIVFVTEMLEPEESLQPKYSWPADSLVQETVNDHRAGCCCGECWCPTHIFSLRRPTKPPHSWMFKRCPFCEKDAR